MSSALPWHRLEAGANSVHILQERKLRRGSEKLGSYTEVSWLTGDSEVKVLVAKLCPTLVTPWTVTHQAPWSMGFSRQEYWGGLPFPSSGDVPNRGIESKSPAPADGFFTT